MKQIFLTLLFAAIAITLQGTPVTIIATGTDRPTVTAGAGPKTLKVGLRGDLDGLTLRGEVRKWTERNPVATISPDSAKMENEFKFQLPDLGIYHVNVIVERDGKPVATTEFAYSAVPQPLADSDRPQEMGTCTHFAQSVKNSPATFALLKLAGFTRIRDDLSWSDIEREQGKYQIRPELDRLADTAIQNGIKLLFVTGYNNYAVYPDKFTKKFPTTQEMLDAYGNAVVFAVKHFGNRVTEWELWNEPNAAHPVKDYLPMLKTLYPKIKAANPNAIVISCGGGGAGGGPGGAMIVPIVNAGGVEFQDGFSIHPYMAPHDPDFGYDAGSNSPIPAVNIPIFTKHLRTFADRNPKKDGRKLLFYITELGWPAEFYSFRSTPVTPEIQAAYLARTYLLNRANGNQPLYWYDFQNDGTDPRYSEHNFGIINSDYSPKPAYQAATVVASMLRNKPFAGSLTDAKVKKDAADAIKKGIYKLYVYGKGDDRMIAIWSTEQSSRNPRVEFKLPFPYEKARLVDWQGAELPLPQKLDGNRIELTLSAWPQYITMK